MKLLQGLDCTYYEPKFPYGYVQFIGVPHIKGKDQFLKRPPLKKWNWSSIMWKNMFWLLRDDTNFAGKPPTIFY